MMFLGKPTLAKKDDFLESSRGGEVIYIFENLSLHIHFRAFKPSYTFLWVGRVLPEAKLENKWTLFFELFDLSDHYIFEHLSLHINF